MELIKSGQVSFQAQDFHAAQPPSVEVPGLGSVPAPAVFLIRGCTHNWPDAAVKPYVHPSHPMPVNVIPKDR